MGSAVIVACITAGASIICQLIIANKGKKETLVENAKKEQALNDKLKSIETKLDEHNGYAQKLGDISAALLSLQKDVEYLRERG